MEKIQYVFIGIGSLFFLWFLAPAVLKGIVNIGNLTGMVLFALVLLYGVFYNRVNHLLRNMMEQRAGKVFLTGLLLVGSIVILLAAIETVLMIHAACIAPEKNQTAIVLGCKVIGEKPSRILEERLNAAYDYMVENPESIVILSGGKGQDEDISEALCMYRYLTEKGIDGERLLMEDASTSTEENLKYASVILKDNELGSLVAVITSEFHEYRASLFAKEAGIEFSSVPSHTMLLYLPTYYVRELYGILAQWFLS